MSYMAGDKGSPGQESHHLGNNARMWGGDIDRGFHQGDGEAPEISGANGDLGARNEVSRFSVPTVILPKPDSLAGLSISRVSS